MKEIVTASASGTTVKDQKKVTAEDAIEIVREHLRDGRVVERLVERNMGKVKAEYLHHRARTREVLAAQAGAPPRKGEP